MILVDILVEKFQFNFVIYNNIFIPFKRTCDNAMIYSCAEHYKFCVSKRTTTTFLQNILSKYLKHFVLSVSWGQACWKSQVDIVLAFGVVMYFTLHQMGSSGKGKVEH